MSDIYREAAGLATRMMLVAEACASVAMSHPEGCGCIVCEAAKGQPHALMAVTSELERDGWRPPV